MSEIKKADLKSMNIPEDKLKQLKQVFPEIFTEGLKVDWDKLRLVMGENIDVGRERFGMNWPGKAECFKNIQAPSVATLVPAKNESVNFDLTENLFIEGDNLEVLKLLQKSYFGKIKMIYIDPPYNTGKDFIYPDDFSESLDTYLKYTGQVDAEGKKFSTNTEESGRFHTKWINMMYSRLYLARNLLKEDGAIFISIDDVEVDNLKKICNEIFGEENKIGSVARISKTTSFQGNYFASSFDYLLCYAKNLKELPKFVDEVDEEQYKKVETDGERRGERYRDDIAFYLSTQTDIRPNQKYLVECPDGTKVIPPCSIQDEIMREGDGRWRWTKEKYLKCKHLLVFKKTKRSPLLDENGNQAKWNVYTKSYLKDKQENGNIPRDLFDGFLNRNGTEELKEIEIPFEFPKPSLLIKHLLKIIETTENDIILDFFAGSCSTAQAVLALNQESKVIRNFICVQLPELTEEDSEAFKAGYKTIADIGKERIRRIIKQNNKVKEQNESEDKFLFDDGKIHASLDLGFKVFKLTLSNFKVWDGEAGAKKETIEKQLEMHVNHINPKSSQEDILFELLLKAGFELTTKIEKISMSGKTVYSIEGGLMLICLEKELTKEVIKAMAEKGPSRVICLDQGFAGNDQLKTNAVQIMKSKGVEDFRTV